MLTFNEGKVCDAIVRHLEVREGAIRADVQWPEAVHHVDPVELTWKLGDQLFALEHTGIEPFDDHMRLEAAAKHHFDPVREALKDVPPDEIIDGSARIRSPPTGHGRADPRESRWIGPTRRAALPTPTPYPLAACKRAPDRPSLNC